MCCFLGEYLVITQGNLLIFLFFCVSSVINLDVTLSSLEAACGLAQLQVARQLLPVPLTMSHIKLAHNVRTTVSVLPHIGNDTVPYTPSHRDSELAHDSMMTITARTTACSAHS